MLKDLKLFLYFLYTFIFPSLPGPVGVHRPVDVDVCETSVVGGSESEGDSGGQKPRRQDDGVREDQEIHRVGALNFEFKLCSVRSYETEKEDEKLCGMQK